MKSAITRFFSLSLALVTSANAGTEVALTADIANSSTPSFGSSVNSPLNDPFAYDCESPTAALPVQIYSPGSMGFHGNEVDGADVFVSYTFPATTLADNESFNIDLYGRDGTDCCPERDDDFDIEVYSGGVGGTLLTTIEGLMIPNAAPYHLRVSLRHDVPFDAIRIIARDTDDPRGSYFTLMEIRAAVLVDPPDTDGDGLPDEWEMEHNLDHTDDGTTDPVNGAAGNPDDDGLDNLGEFENDTDPRDADSDDDMLDDGAEVNGAGSRPPTDPNNPDSDFDTLSDLVETNTGIFIGPSDTGSNPLDADSDDDGAGDAAEVRRSTDPSDPMSGTNLAAGKPIGFFDPAGNAVGAWSSFPATNMVDNNLATVSHPADMASSDYYVELDLGEEIPIGFVVLTGRGFADGCCAERLENTTLAILDGGGNVVSSQVLNEQIQFTLEVDLSAVQPRGRYVRVINSGGFDYGPQLGELEVYGSAGLPTDFAITAFEFDTATGMASLTFDSTPGAMYAIFGSGSMRSGQWAEVDDAVNSQGDTTTVEFTDLDLIGKERYFYQVRRP